MNPIMHHIKKTVLGLIIIVLSLSIEGCSCGFNNNGCCANGTTYTTTDCCGNNGW